MLFIPSLMLILGSKKEAEPEVVPTKMGEYEWEVNPHFSSYKEVKFFPKGSDETPKV